MSTPHSSPQELLMVLAERLREQTVARPFATLAAATGVGYVLGAGTPSIAVRMGSQLAMRAAMTAVMAGIGLKVATDDQGPREADESSQA